MALLYWPVVEFIKRVLTTSTGEATMVVQKPAANAAVKWQGRLSVDKHIFAYVKIRNSCFKVIKKSL